MKDLASKTSPKLYEEILFNEDQLHCPLTNEDCLRIKQLVEQTHQVRFDLLEIVLVDEQSIVSINQEYLGKDYVTDIITFDYSEDEYVSGTLYCCAPRIIEQSKEFTTTERDEFLRVFAHGMLHLVGFSDTSEEQSQEMRLKEEEIIKAFYE